MAFFFPRTVYHTQAPVSPLLSLMSDLDTLSRPRRNRDVCYVYRAPVPVPAPAPAPRSWQPRFNAQETANVYLIRGELPGIGKEHISIEFPEPQKMVITGKIVESSKQDVAEPTAHAVAQPTEETPAPPTSRPVSPVSDGARSRASYQAYVEDSDENDDFDVVSNVSSNDTEPEEKRVATPTSSEEPSEPATVAQAPAAPAPQPEPSERVIGQFSRTYTFPTPVDHDAVTADLKDGFLTVVVPKPRKSGPRRILI
ncbi:HSP20-like chaperone, partial [Stachybotrys elegans]